MSGDQGHHHRAANWKHVGIDTYSCQPYSSWQKGSVEHAVGLTRRIWPKKTDYALIPDEEIAIVKYRLNTRLRRRFGFLTPLEYTLSVAFSP